MHPKDQPSTTTLAFISTLATLAVPGVACVLVPYWILTASGTPPIPVTGPLQILAVPLAALGVFLIIWVSTAFVRSGRGTPFPGEPPARLVVTGLYRSVRNPMYTGAVLLVLAEALYFQSGWLVMYALGMWAVLHTALLVFEEPQLKRRFGDEYEQYTKSVPRWIPKWPL